MKLKHVVIIPTLLALSSLSQAEQLKIEVTDINSKKGGNLVVHLYKGDQGWMEADGMLVEKIFPIKDKTLMVTLEDLEPGDDYAVQVYQDANENGEIDFRWFPYPKPKEGVGLSNNDIGFGPPSYKKSRFEIKGDTAISIKMEYL